MAVESVGIAGTGLSMQQIAGTVAGLDKMASTVVGAFSPTGKIVDTVGSALGLPDPLKAIAKIAVGVGTGDVAGIVSGAFGVAAALTEAVAATQYHPPADPVKACRGYAPPHDAGSKPGCAPRPPPPPGHCEPRPPPTPPCGKPRVDPELLCEKQALEVLCRDFGAIDNAGGFWFADGRFSGFDMSAVAHGPFPEEMKQAVRYLQAHPDKFFQMDRADGFDGLVSRATLQDRLCRVNAQLAQQQGPHPAGPAGQAGPAGPSGPSSPAAPAPSLAPEPGAQSLEGRMLSRLSGAQQEVDALMERAMENPDDKNLQLQLQKAQERVKALFTMLSDMYKHDNDMRMHALQNLK